MSFIVGIKGCIMHGESKKCLHPFGGKANPKDGEKLVFHSDCYFSRIQFTMTADNVIKHVPSGLCIHVNISKLTIGKVQS
jgi:hypothetical protein